MNPGSINRDIEATISHLRGISETLQSLHTQLRNAARGHNRLRRERNAWREYAETAEAVLRELADGTATCDNPDGCDEVCRYCGCCSHGWIEGCLCSRDGCGCYRVTKSQRAIRHDMDAEANLTDWLESVAAKREAGE